MGGGEGAAAGGGRAREKERVTFPEDGRPGVRQGFGNLIYAYCLLKYTWFFLPSFGACVLFLRAPRRDRCRRRRRRSTFLRSPSTSSFSSEGFVLIGFINGRTKGIMNPR